MKPPAYPWPDALCEQIGKFRLRGLKALDILRGQDDQHGYRGSDGLTAGSPSSYICSVFYTIGVWIVFTSISLYLQITVQTEFLEIILQ